jgi:gamma-glutamylcyclotransferase (GGCT)/AIG2-like uncharacterized protein YtfP
MNLFIYGTLIVPEIWRRVVGRDCRRQSALVRGMRVVRATGELYPVMVATEDEHSAASGYVVFDVTAKDIAALDDYESAIYDRIAVQAELDSGELVDAQTYLLPRRSIARASEEPWTLDWFEREGLSRYLAECRW